MRTGTLLSLVIALFALTNAAYAQQGPFTINGRVKIDGGGLEGTRLVIHRNGEKERVITNNLSKFALDLQVGQSYTLSFEKDGFVTKKLNFDTHVPTDAASNGFTPFEFAVSMFKQYDDVNMVVFNQPVGMIRFDPTLDDFDYDTDYTKSIQSQLQKTMEEVAQKQKEEAEQNAAEASSKAEEEKAKAKAEADVKAKAAEDAKLAARQQREQQEVAKQAEVERQKAELAAKKAEDQRLAEESRKAKEAAKPVPTPKPAPAPKPDPPAPVAKKEAPKPVTAAKGATPKPPAPRVVHTNTLSAKASSGTDGRRAVSPKSDSEDSPIHKAAPVAKEETRPEVVVPVEEVVRNEELIVEPNQVVTLVKLETDAQKYEYRKVVRKYGGTFYFKNGQPCSQLVYEREALAEVR